MSEHEIKMRDLVFPIVAAKKLSDGYSYERFLGTGFWVGSQGYALTAGHVVEQSMPESCCITGMFVHPRDNYWLVFELNSKSVHSTEDVALINFQGRLEEGSSIRVSFESQHSAFEYHLFGYPEANLLDCIDNKNHLGKVLERPDLIYSKGHIRRRVSWNLLNIKGKSFYELSSAVGSGCSGSPIFSLKNDILYVYGIYVADKYESAIFKGYNKALEWTIHTVELPSTLGYAVRTDALKNWIPENLGTTLDKIG